MPETPTSSALSPDIASRAGAGALLLTVAVAELWLAFWDAGWWHRAGASVVAFAGVLLLAHAIAVLLPSVSRPALRVPRRRTTSPPSAAARVVLAD